LFSAVGERGWRAFRLGYAAGLAHYLSSLYWLLAMPLHLPRDSARSRRRLGCFERLLRALSGGLGLALLENLAGAAGRGEDAGAGGSGPVFFRRTLAAGRMGLLRRADLGGAGNGARTVADRISLEFSGVSQYKMLPLIQIAAVTGVYGVSFLVVWMSVSLVVALVALTRQPGRGCGVKRGCRCWRRWWWRAWGLARWLKSSRRRWN